MTEHIPSESLLDVEKVLPILDKISIFGGLSEPQLFQVLELLKSVHYEPGETIFEVGGSASYIYIIRSGNVNLYYEVEGESVQKAELITGACFGDISVIGIQPHSATAVATTKTDLLVLSGEALDSLFNTDLKLFSMLILNIARDVCRRMHKTNTQLVNCLVKYPDVDIDGIQGY